MMTTSTCVLASIVVNGCERAGTMVRAGGGVTLTHTPHVRSEEFNLWLLFFGGEGGPALYGRIWLVSSLVGDGRVN
ncbi:hypothetical protein BJV78DRAFT_1246986 [Lactifluus subvellereus]|nr:hypothetical protein BJV78DRAFT_1246986 [Lactifluus subvellereus]